MLQKDDSEILSAFPFPEEFTSQGGRDHRRMAVASVTKEMAGRPGRGRGRVKFLGAGGFPGRRKGHRYMLCFKAVVPNFCGIRDRLHGRQFFYGPVAGGGGRMVQAVTPAMGSPR